MKKTLNRSSPCLNLMQKEYKGDDKKYPIPSENKERIKKELKLKIMQERNENLYQKAMQIYDLFTKI